jgi:hypothetical protein
MARNPSDGSKAKCAGVNRNPSTCRASVRFDRCSANANLTALHNVTAWHAYTPDCEATRVETRATTLLARKALL